MNRGNRLFTICIPLLFAAFALPLGDAYATVLERIQKTGVVKIAYRVDAAPYSYENEIGEPAGYTIDLCRAVTVSLKEQLGLQKVSIEYLPVTAETRFDTIQRAEADMLCGATTATLSRRKLIDFSLPIFVDGASVLYRVDGPKSFDELTGKTIGVLSGTRTEQALKKTLLNLSLTAHVISVASHEDGLRKLEANEVSAYFADQAILLFLVAKSASPNNLRLSKKFFTHEPYAIGLPRGDSDFRLAIDRALSRIYRAGAIEAIFDRNFRGMRPSDLIKALYLISALPE